MADVEQDQTILWESNAIHFPRLLAELNAVGLTRIQLRKLVASMDITQEEVMELMARAESAWEGLKGGEPVQNQVRELHGVVDYVLAEEATAWVEVGPITAWIRRADEGVVVELYATGCEMEEALASAYAFNGEAEGVISEAAAALTSED